MEANQIHDDDMLLSGQPSTTDKLKWKILDENAAFEHRWAVEHS